MHELPRVQGSLEQTAAHTHTHKTSPEKGLGIASLWIRPGKGVERAALPILLGSEFWKHDESTFSIRVIRLKAAEASLRSAPVLALPLHLISQEGRGKEQAEMLSSKGCRIAQLE